MCIKMSKNLSANYYQEKKRKTVKKGSRKISKSFWRGKRKRWQYGHGHNKNLAADEKKSLLNIEKKYYKMKKIALS